MPWIKIGTIVDGEPGEPAEIQKSMPSGHRLVQVLPDGPLLIEEEYEYGWAELAIFDGQYGKDGAATQFAKRLRGADYRVVYDYNRSNGEFLLEREVDAE